MPTLSGPQLNSPSILSVVEMSSLSLALSLSLSLYLSFPQSFSLSQRCGPVNCSVIFRCICPLGHLVWQAPNGVLFCLRVYGGASVSTPDWALQGINPTESQTKIICSFGWRDDTCGFCAPLICSCVLGERSSLFHLWSDPPSPFQSRNRVALLRMVPYEHIATYCVA